MNNGGRLFIQKKVYVEELGGVIDDNYVRLSIQVGYVCPNFGPWSFRDFVENSKFR